ncbi:hypothetical protein ELQ88_15895 [Pseudomonas sp. MPC6]|nr:hypothetical protein ELQ88_15895 [Pseudomonas sp. MPC6]
MYRRLRQQAGSYTRSVAFTGLVCAEDPPVGAGLPAKAVVQSTLLLNVPPPSPASRLLHEIGGVHRSGVR